MFTFVHNMNIHMRMFHLLSLLIASFLGCHHCFTSNLHQNRINSRFLSPFPSSSIRIHQTTQITSALNMETRIRRIQPYSYSNFNITVLSDPHPSKRNPCAIYLPGLDGVGFYTVPALANLSQHYELYKLEIPPSDRSSFTTIASIVESFLINSNTSFTIIGESFGGLVATYLASKHIKHISSLVLINPATSFDRTLWSSLSPLITNSGPLFPIATIGTLFTSIVQPDQILRIGTNVFKKIANSENPAKSFNALVSTAQEYYKLLPPNTLEWRISRWLNIGTKLMASRFSLITTPTFILIGAKDALLPSYTESYRLESRLINAAVEVKELSNGGHAIIDDILDLHAVLSTSKLLGPPKLPIPIDIPFPTVNEINEVNELFSSFVKAYSPIFLSKTENNSLIQSIDTVPIGQQGRPVLLVGNHQLYGIDTGLIIREFIQKRDTIVRGLGHPMLFTNSTPDVPIVGDVVKAVFPFTQAMSSSVVLTKFGAVEVSPSSIYALLQRNETILLYPGGGLELGHGKLDAYKLFWQNSTDFVRMAAACDAIIVPFGAIGVADSVRILVDGKEIRENPFLAVPAQRIASRLPRARAAVPETFVLPLGIPTEPRRIYFLFQQAFDTRTINMNNKRKCREAYMHVKAQVEESIATLLEFRESDPYDRFVPRIAYEIVNGSPAPTGTLGL